MFGLSFNHAAYLGLLVIVVPLVVAVWYASAKATIHARLVWAEEHLLTRLSRPLTLRSQVPAGICWALAAALLIVAAAGPSLPMAPKTAKAGSLQVIVAFDVSKSEAAEDYHGDIPGSYLQRFYNAHGSRLDESKYVVETQVLPALRGNQVGLVTYKGDGFAQAPLTDDFSSLEFVLENWVRIDNAPGGGSDYARGLQQAIDMFKNSKSNTPNAQRVIVLFSDGGFTGDQQMLAQVTDELRQENIRLVILGLGYNNNARVPQYDTDTGQFLGYYQLNGADARTSINESTLRTLASMSGGSYYHVTGSDLGINWPTALSGRTKVVEQRVDVYKVPLTAALLLILALAITGVSRERSKLRVLLLGVRSHTLRLPRRRQRKEG